MSFRQATYSLLACDRAMSAAEAVALARGGIKTIYALRGLPTDEQRRHLWTHTRESRLTPAVPGLLVPVAIHPDAPEVEIIDGVLGSARPDDLRRWFFTDIPPNDPRLGFDVEQYRIEHAPAEAQVILVAAGAGTGKTTTMVSRVLYLLATQEDLKPADITLITFTRAAAAQMRHRLSEALGQAFLHTGSSRHRDWLGGLADCDICTIDAWCRRIIAAGSLEDAGGPAARVRTWGREQDRILDRAITRALQERDGEPRTGPGVIPTSIFGGWRYDLLRRGIKKVWDSAETKGIHSQQRLEQLLADGAWAKAERRARGGEDLDAILFAEVAPRALALAVRAFEDIRRSRRQLSVGDLLDRALEALGSSKTGSWIPPRFLFIDEFQDTNPRQIELVRAIRALEQGPNRTRVLVVGDRKQSIYGFRGATPEWFAEDRLRKGLQVDEVLSFPISTCYRSTRRLIGFFNDTFARLGRDHDDAFEFRPLDELRHHAGAEQGGQPVAVVATSSWQRDVDHAIPVPPREDLDEEEAASLETVRQALGRRRDLAKPDGDEAGRDLDLALLVRTNAQVAAITSLIERYRDEIELGDERVVSIGSHGVFESRAARELLVLLQSVLEPYDPGALLELLDTRWMARLSEGRPTWMRWNESSDPGSLVRECEAFIDRTLQQARSEHDAQDAVPPPPETWPALWRLMAGVDVDDGSEVPPLLATISALRRSLLRADTAYQGQLDRVLGLALEAFHPADLDAAKLEDWLRLHIGARSEDDGTEASPAQGRGIKVMTVHQAKGLEFDIVALPCTDFPLVVGGTQAHFFEVKRPGVVAPEDITFEVGWRVRHHRSRSEGGWPRSGNWQRAEEHLTEASVEEECRLLYVALTRAKHHVCIALAGGWNSWAELLAAALGGGR